VIKEAGYAQGYYRRYRWISSLTTLGLILLTLSGCAMVGPRAISAGRAHYNEAINKTEDEQMLLWIVKGRYGETSSLLAVSGVAANVRFSTNASIQAGLGPQENFAGNLVPLSGGLAYEENPTITYSPVQGERYLRQFLSPIPLDILILLTRNETFSATTFILLADRINEMRNPNFVHGPPAAPESRFQRFVQLYGELDRVGVLQLAADPRENVPYCILITGYAPAYTDKVSEYLTLLGLPVPKDKSKDIIIPVYFAAYKGKSEGIALSTRSTFDLIQILRAAIEVPQEHMAEGLTVNYPAPGLAGKDIHVHASKDEPKRAAVAVNYRGYWFYIDDADLSTKLFYRMVRTLWSVSIAASADMRAAPVLTIPVSR
jgi:hypothetical protein